MGAENVNSASSEDFNRQTSGDFSRQTTRRGRTTNIAIIGAGLVGSLLAIYLAKRGYNVSLFERRKDMRKGNADAGRSINLALSTRGIRALEEVGLADELKRVAIPMNGRMMHDIHGNLTFQPYGKEGQYINSISRSNLNVVLMNEAERVGASIFFEERCANVDFQNTSITTTSGTKTFDLIIGADGAYSAVRWAMQITDRFNFSQHYIDHGYKEFHIPPGRNGAFQLEKNALHIWPRESFMMIALPNPDGSFTCTLFFPFEGEPSFASLTTKERFKSFFQQTFPDALQLMPGLIEDFEGNPTSSLVTIKCFPWVRNKTFLIGDAAHGIVPFYGQGMNAGFEDCRILNELLTKHHDDWDYVLPEFQSLRKPDTDAIAQLALDNFIEMRDLVADADFLLRKKIEAKLHQLYPDKWIPLYSMVTFNDQIRYSQAYAKGQKQKQIMDEVMKATDIFDRWETLDYAGIVQKL
ncbi:MAG TPA: NAD(P)/FAD-dependent oxidoreductase [Chryseosolibacter sp.]